MKKIFLILFLLFFTNCSVQAIDWAGLTSPRGKAVYLDKDSIKEYKGYFFYNIKFKNSHGIDVVITMQSGELNPFSARINSYTPSEYDRLNGDYSNITLNMTKKLEPVTYNSTVYTCYKEVKKIMKPQQKPIITF